MDSFRLIRRQRRELDEALAQCHDARWYRRLLALRLLDQGQPASQVAATLGVSRQSVYNWMRSFQNSERLDALQDRSRQGRPPLSDERLRDQLDTWLAQSPEEHGYFAGTWTIPLLAEHLRHTSGRELSASTLRRQLHALGYSWKRSRYVLDPDPQREKKTPNPADIGRFAGP